MTAARARNAEQGYGAEFVPRFHMFLRRTVPRSAKVLVVSKGDGALVDVDGLDVGHFPQRGDGVYLGYYPKTSAAAIEHLDQLKGRGVEFLAFPKTALWWLDHYADFAEHLNSDHRLIALDEQVAALYALFSPGQRPGGQPAARAPQPNVKLVARAQPDRASTPSGGEPPAGGARMTRRHTSEVDEAQLRVLFDAEHYRAQAELHEHKPQDVLEHYMSEGYRRGYTPHRLFDVAWYLEHNPEAAGQNPLAHFVIHSAERALDPNPFFDTAYYQEQARGSKLRGTALQHYIEHASSNNSYHPNPLFRDGYYLRTYPDAATSGTPLEHYLAHGSRDGRSMSDLHRRMLGQLAKTGQPGLARGNWKFGSVLCFAQGTKGEGDADIVAIAEELSGRRHVDATVVAHRRADVDGRLPTSSHLLVLEDFQLAAPVLRASARRLLAHALAAAGPMFALCEDVAVLQTLTLSGVGSYFVLPGDGDVGGSTALARAFRHSARVIAPSSGAYLRAAERLSTFPTNVATRHPGDRRYLDSVLELAERDFGVELRRPAARRRSATATRRLVIPCPDWGVSGVNASLHALGTELAARGWDVGIVFTRDQAWVERSAAGASLPSLPHRFLRRRKPGVEGLWEALIAELERNAPQSMLTSYDFVANGVISALGERIGIAMWVQADDGDYYEQAYRLGRYCDAVVCVSGAIATKLAALNPALAELTRVIPNSSIHANEIVAGRRRGQHRLRIVYTGRLVQYQKRVFDFIALADALEAIDLDYEIVLIGAFPPHADTEEQFVAAASRHLATGRIRLAGRRSREEILAELDQSDLFVLLSDFEGLPLSLVEAMARGSVPVAAAMDSGVPEVITAGENGLIVSGRDYRVWAREIAALTSDKRRLARMSQRARATVRRSFTVESAADKFEETLGQIGRLASAGTARRPDALHWGRQRSLTGDVLPPPSLFRADAIQIAGLRVADQGEH